MSIKKISIISIFLFAFLFGNAQTAIDYYHTAANFYIQGEKKNAKKTIEEAISKYPNDAKLKQLAAKVNKLPDKKNNDKQNKDQKKDQNKDKQDQNKDQQQKDQQQKDQQQQQQQQPKPQMSKENAQQILDALMQDEKNTQEKAKKQQVRGTKKAEKDW